MRKADILSLPKAYSRRTFLKGTGSAFAVFFASSLSPPLWAHVTSRQGSLWLKDQKLTFNLSHIHTGEKLRRQISVDELSDSIFRQEISHFLRDWRTNEIVSIDQKLIDLLGHMTQKVSTQKPFQIVCGYRSEKTNQFLISRGSSRVASNSFHLTGKAIDFYHPGTPLSNLRDHAKKSAAGGVGYYPKSGFIHMDVRGHPAYW